MFLSEIEAIGAGHTSVILTHYLHADPSRIARGNYVYSSELKKRTMGSQPTRPTKLGIVQIFNGQGFLFLSHGCIS